MQNLTYKTYGNTVHVVLTTLSADNVEGLNVAIGDFPFDDVIGELEDIKTCSRDVDSPKLVLQIAKECHTVCKIPFILTVILFKIQDKVTKNLVFVHTLYKTGGTLCERLSTSHFTYLHQFDANQLYNNYCRCVTYLSV